ncbi:MAG: integrase family protein [Proteobacteria bacterium]|nr:integrase family protein [Pseudomonadota bacterium]
MPFDARAAKLLQPGQTIIVKEHPGLRLVATTSRRTWIYRYRSPVDGRLRQIAIGQWPEPVSYGRAVARWEDLQAARNDGQDPAAAKKAERAAARPAPAMAGYTIRQLCDDYLAGHVDRHRKAKGAAEVRRQFDTMLGNLAGVQASALTRAQAFKLLEDNAHRPVVAGQLRQELGGAWDYALDAGRLPEDAVNWWRLIMRGRLRSKGHKIQGEHVGTAKRVLDQVELGALIRWLPNFTALVEDGLTMYLWTGTRGAEILAMEAREITEEPDGLWWTIPKAKTKNARIELATDLRVPLVGRAEAIVRRRLALYPSGYLFPSTGKLSKHVQQKALGVAVHYRMPYSRTRPKEDRARLPVERWAPHDLRRSARTLLAAMGCPDSIAEAILGHIQPGVQGVYNRHGYDKERRQWLTALDLKLEELARQLPGRA